MMNVPSFQITNDELQNLVRFIYRHESMLKDFGAIKIQLDDSCVLSLKKRQTSMKRASVSQCCIHRSTSSLVYHVEHNGGKRKQSSRQTSAVRTEHTFWSDLAKSKKHEYTIESLPDKSGFCEKALRHSFDIHQIPARSLLKLGGAHFTRSIIPSLKHAAGRGTVFPLSTASHHLYSLDYHHEGGTHHWYVIPHTERLSLEHLLDQAHIPDACLDHGKVVIDPSVLDRNSIRYHHIEQKPKEFVVVSAGALAQRFSVDASWSESIVFALPSWIQDGHAERSQVKRCSCDFADDHMPKSIDLDRFRQNVVQRYIARRLHSTENHHQAGRDGSNTKTIDESFGSSHDSTNQTMASNGSETRASAPIDFDEEVQADDCDRSEVDLGDLWTLTSTDFPQSQESELETLISSAQATIDDDGSLDDQISTPANEPSNNMIFRNSTSAQETRRVPMKSRKEHILMVWNIDGRLKKSDVHRHFPGSFKVVLKPCQGSIDLQYAFVYHFSSWEAKRNVRWPKSLKQLGDKCYVERGRDASTLHGDPESKDRKIVSVTGIPDNVREEEVKDLFHGCDVLKYCPARWVEGNPRTGKPKKLLTGYAFIRYDDSKQADYVMMHADHYFLHGKSVTVAWKHSTKKHHAH